MCTFKFDWIKLNISKLANQISFTNFSNTQHTSPFPTCQFTIQRQMNLFINQPYQNRSNPAASGSLFCQTCFNFRNHNQLWACSKNQEKLQQPRSSLPVLVRWKSSPNSYSSAWCHCSTSLAYRHQARKTFSTVEIVLSTDCITASMVKGQAERLASQPTWLWLGEQLHSLRGIHEIAKKKSARQTSQAGWSDWCGPL